MAHVCVCECVCITSNAGKDDKIRRQSERMTDTMTVKEEEEKNNRGREVWNHMF